MPTENVTDAWIGQSFGPYRVVALLSHSAIGSVYEAARNGASIDAKVSLSVVPERFFHSPAAIAHFRREVPILARLDHPNIARVIDSGEIPAPYLVTELPEGVPLKRYCREFSVKKSVRVFIGICNAMQICARTFALASRSEVIQHSGDAVRRTEDTEFRHRESHSRGALIIWAQAVDIGRRIMQVGPAQRCAGFRDASTARTELKSQGWPAPSMNLAPAACDDK